MPQSRQRHKHHHHNTPTNTPHSPRPATRKSAAPIMAIFVAVIAVGITFLSGAGTTILVVAGIGGAIVGFLIGSSMDKTASKK